MVHNAKRAVVSEWNQFNDAEMLSLKKNKDDHIPTEDQLKVL